MCGIVGKIDFSGRSDPALIERMCATIEHRGPNSRGIWCHEGASLGMQRLAIIDVAGGDQPMFNEDRSVAVVMNGEIYNFPQLREELLVGPRLTTRSDTEVLVHLYEENGEELVHRLRGMFAFAIWDFGAAAGPGARSRGKEASVRRPPRLQSVVRVGVVRPAAGS